MRPSSLLLLQQDIQERASRKEHMLALAAAEHKATNDRKRVERELFDSLRRDKVDSIQKMQVCAGAARGGSLPLCCCCCTGGSMQRVCEFVTAAPSNADGVVCMTRCCLSVHVCHACVPAGVPAPAAAGEDHGRKRQDSSAAGTGAPAGCACCMPLCCRTRMQQPLTYTVSCVLLALLCCSAR